jgi:pimeloyl-ACP methyl ester carboxylesterase
MMAGRGRSGRRIAASLACALLLAGACESPTVAVDPARWTETPISVNADGDLLHGTLTRPAGASAFDIVLIHPSVGNTDRNGNEPGQRNDSLARLAHGLAGRGIASVRIDMRGIGASEAAFTRQDMDMTPAVLAADAKLWADRLRAEEGTRHVYLLGHGQGALTVTLAATLARPDGLILIAGAGIRGGEYLRRHIRAQGAGAEYVTVSDAIISELEAGRRVVGVPTDFRFYFREDTQGYLIEWFGYDPVQELTKSSAPTLVVQGTNDLEVATGDARRLAGARNGITLLLIDGMNHVLRIAPKDAKANFWTYKDFTKPLAPGLVDAIADFIRSVPAR